MRAYSVKLLTWWWCGPGPMTMKSFIGQRASVRTAVPQSCTPTPYLGPGDKLHRPPGDTAHSVLPVRPGENLVMIKVPLPKTSPHSPPAAPSYVLGLEILVLLHVTLPGAEFIRFILHPHGSPPAHVSPQSLTAHSPATGRAGPYDRLASA